MNTITVKPVAGRLILMPDQNFRKLTEVTVVPDDMFYRRAVLQGDIAIVAALDVASVTATTVTPSPAAKK